MSPYDIVTYGSDVQYHTFVHYQSFVLQLLSNAGLEK